MSTPPIPPNSYEIEPSAEVREAAHSMREMFVALVNEGFTERQALAIIAEIMAAGIQASSGNDD